MTYTKSTKEYVTVVTVLWGLIHRRTGVGKGVRDGEEQNTKQRKRKIKEMKETINEK